MTYPIVIDHKIERLIETALAEDLSELGDVTSELLIPKSKSALANIIAKSAGVVAGIPIAKRVFQMVDESLRFEEIREDGDKISPSDIVLTISGSTRSILTAERTALNFLQRLSGIATLTAQFVERIAGAPATILDTRKTTPGLRALEKYAVRVGGGHNHRLGLFDMILIKENHIAAAGGITKAVAIIRGELEARKLPLAVEVETKTLEEVNEALVLKVDRIMLDNMPVPQIREAVKMVSGRAELEVSGGVTLETVRAIAETDVDYISVGALTHSAPALDLSLLI
jgi:nicotinate-nucleotide pyrophosphorylase (carboxylating)